MTAINENAELMFIISPFKGVEDAHKKVHAICREVVLEGYVPIAPHGYFTLFLDDEDPTERLLGIAAGQVLLAKCSRARIYGKYISDGMKSDINVCVALGILLEQKIGNEVKPYNPPDRTGVPTVLPVDCSDETAYDFLKLVWTPAEAKMYFEVLVDNIREKQSNKIERDQAREQVRSNIWTYSERAFDWQTRKRVRELFRELLS